MMNEDEDRLPRTTIGMMYKAIFIQKHRMKDMMISHTIKKGMRRLTS